MQRWAIARLAGVLICAAASAGSAIPVSLTTPPPSVLDAVAFDAMGAGQGANHFPTSLPDAGSLHVESGASFATLVFDLSSPSFTIAWEYQGTAMSSPTLRFTVGADLAYELEGSFAAEAASLVQFRGALRDHTTGVFLFQNEQLSLRTPDESFALGQAGGDTINTLAGSLQGVLLAGHEYSLAAIARVASPSLDDVSGTHARGSLRLLFVPEPATAALVALGLVALAARQRPRIRSTPGRHRALH
jgi:hypothetical protein